MRAVPLFISNYSKELLANTREFCCESPCLILVKRCCSERDLNAWKNTWLYSDTWFAGQKLSSSKVSINMHTLGGKDGEKERPGTSFGTHLRPMGLNVLGYQSHLGIVATLLVPRRILLKVIAYVPYLTRRDQMST